MDKNKTYTIALNALFLALIIIGAFIKIPLPPVPIALQFTMCLLAILLLGAKQGTICIGLYIAMGLIGIPIFTAGGGFAYVLKPTFGYLLGYLIGAPIVGTISRIGYKNKPNIKSLLLASFTFLIIVYTIGVIYMYLILNLYVESPITMGKAIVSGALLFLPMDSVWCVVSSFVALKVLPRLRHYTKPNATLSKENPQDDKSIDEINAKYE